MALIIYLTKAPRYQNIVTDIYETIPMEDIVLIEKYFNWGKAREEERSKTNTFKEWCGVSEKQLPHQYIINYYREFFTEKKTYVEGIGEIEHYGIFEQAARIVKSNQIFNWFIKNIMNNKADKEYHEVSHNQLQSLLDSCNKVKDSFILSENNEYVVNEDVAKEVLPLMEKTGYFFGTNKYDNIYARQVINFTNTLSDILSKTDFEKETIYVNAIW